MEEFTLTEEKAVTFSLGFVAANSTSTSNPYLFFDYIKLEKSELKSIDTGISSPSFNTSAEIEAIYNLYGIRIPSLQKGINIIKYTDGSSKKILVK
jgi:hypothetical protein